MHSSTSPAAGWFLVPEYIEFAFLASKPTRFLSEYELFVFVNVWAAGSLAPFTKAPVALSHVPKTPEFVPFVIFALPVMFGQT